MSNMKKVSAKLFGRSMRLPLAVWVLNQEGSFFIRQAAEQTGYSSNDVSAELRRMLETGMLRRVEDSTSAGRKYFSRTDSELWNIIRAASEAVGE